MKEMTARRIAAALLAAAIGGGALYGFASRNRWAEYEWEMQSPAPDPPGAFTDTEFAFARLRYRSFNDRRAYKAWGIDANTSERHFIEGLRRLTRIDGRIIEHIVDASSDEIFDWPWIYVVSGGDWVLSESEAERLRKFFERGGFMIVDDFHGEVEWERFMEGILQIWPSPTVEDLPNESEVFHTVYDLTDRVQVPGYQIVERGTMWERNNGIQPYWRAILDDRGRIMVGAFLNQDLGDAWEFADDPLYPEQFASMAYRVGVNYVIYAMTH